MDQDRSSAAFARIEAALARIEAAHAKIAAPSRPAPPPNEAGLSARHERLRATVTDTLHELDRLIEGISA